MAVVSVADQYMVMMAISLLFTVLALAYNKNLLLGLLAGISWIISSLAHFSVGSQTSPLTPALGYLFLLFAFIFIINIMANVFRARTGRKKEERYGMEL